MTRRTINRLSIRPRKTLFFVVLFAFLALLSSCSARDVDPVSENDTGGTNPDASQASLVSFDGPYSGYEIRDTNLVYAYREASPFASVLKECVVIESHQESCAVSKLPFIGDGNRQPTIDDVMARVLVTHSWMGERFEEMLQTVPPEVMTMFSSTTAILIGSNVRPSHYWTANGAIQLDPVYLWTSLEEKSSISKQDDFRSDYGIDLQFWFLSRTADRSGERLTPYYSLDDDSVRPIEDVKLPLVRLLVHELAHATDFMPRSQIDNLDSTLSVSDAISSIATEWLSPRLTAGYPLTSMELEDFADVRYSGFDATNQQKATTATNMGEYMNVDGAIKFYSYTSIREDLAQLVEAAVMGYRYDAIGNIGFTQKPTDEESYTCDDLLVSWGQRDRLADPIVNVRARAATELALSLTPEMSTFLDIAMGSAEAMEKNVGWCDNQKTSTAIADELSVRSSGRAHTPTSGAIFLEMMRADSTAHPEGIQTD